MLMMPTLFLLATIIQLADTLLSSETTSNSGNLLQIASDTSPPASAQFQSETLDEYYAENSAPVAVQAADSDNEMIVLKNPKRFSYYPRPQGNYGGYGGYRPNPPPLGYSYVGYINRQSRRYPVMMYTLVQCVPCQRAKHLLATTYGDVPSHFLEMVGKEDWQRQLQVDLLKVTGQATFPYVFVCGQFIGGSSDLFNMHHSGQLRQVLNNCMARGG